MYIYIYIYICMYVYIYTLIILGKMKHFYVSYSLPDQLYGYA
jgi:hypothetical protein